MEMPVGTAVTGALLAIRASHTRTHNAFRVSPSPRAALDAMVEAGLDFFSRFGSLDDMVGSFVATDIIVEAGLDGGCSSAGSQAAAET
jgi:hypothetical protein